MMRKLTNVGCPGDRARKRALALDHGGGKIRSMYIHTGLLERVRDAHPRNEEARFEMPPSFGSQQSFCSE
jgi:hypothetical protein